MNIIKEIEVVYKTLEWLLKQGKDFNSIYNELNDNHNFNKDNVVEAYGNIAVVWGNEKGTRFIGVSNGNTCITFVQRRKQ